MTIVIHPYYPSGSARSTRSALSRRAHGVYASEADYQEGREPVFVTLGYPGWLFKSHVYKPTTRVTSIPAHLTWPTPEQARRLVPGAYGLLPR